jgi:hypothetical protein
LVAFRAWTYTQRQKNAVEDFFSDGLYANAVEDGCKALDLLVRLRSGRDDPSRVTLMQTRLVKIRRLAFNELNTDSDQNEQRGMMFMYTRVMAAFVISGLTVFSMTNPIRLVSFVSFLLKALDGAKKRKS